MGGPGRNSALTADEAGALFAGSFGDADHVLLAVSGGADSTALLVLAADWAGGSEGPRLSVATVDHGLRAEAETEIALVAVLSKKLGLPHRRLAAPVADASSGVEEAAREARYDALAAHAKKIGAGRIATAHTLDDQAETVLMRLCAGSGPAGLAAMRPESAWGGALVVRPFLTIPKSRLLASLLARGVSWAKDAMNADPRFARARLRAGREALAREGLTPERLATLASRAARAEDALAHAVAHAAVAHLALAPGSAAIDREASSLPAEIRLRLLARAVETTGGGRLRLDRLERLFARSASGTAGAATLAGAKIAWSADGVVRATPAPPRRAKL